MTTYRVVMSADSIGAMAWDITSGAPYFCGRQWVTGVEEWRNLEFGRNCKTRGMKNWATTTEMWPLLRDRSQPGGWLIMQDNGAGTNDADWCDLWSQVVDELPNDRTLIAVLCGFRSDIDPTLSAELASRSQQMREILAPHRSVIFVHFDQYLRRNPGHFADGQHPNATAATYLRDVIDDWTG